MISSENVPHYTLVLSEREINTIACAMNHIFIDEEGLSDPYFTKEEWSRVQRRHKNLLEKKYPQVQVILKKCVGGHQK